MNRSIAHDPATFGGMLPLSRSSDFSAGGDGGSLEAGTPEFGGKQNAPVSPERIRELEALLARQQEQLSTALKFLNEAAYLAKYHQPSLERHIRAFVNGVQC